MDRAEIDALFEQGKIDELIEVLEKAMEDEYEEYHMLKLGQCYLLNKDEKKAKKLVRRLKMLFPSGEYREEEDALLDAISKGAIEDYLKKWCQSKSVQETIVSNMAGDEKFVAEKKITNLSQIVNQTKRKKKKEIVIPESIKEYFEDVVGLETYS